MWKHQLGQEGFTSSTTAIINSGDLPHIVCPSSPSKHIDVDSLQKVKHEGHDEISPSLSPTDLHFLKPVGA